MNPLPQALAVRSAGLSVRLNEDALAKAVADGASPARLAELADAVLAAQEAYRRVLLELRADVDEELALLPDACAAGALPPERVAGDLREPGKGW